MNLSDALKLLDGHELQSSTLECLITRQTIKHEMKLKCGHSFEYSALLNNLNVTQNIFNHHSCPYCRSVFKNFIPLYEECIEEIPKDMDIKIFRKNDYLACQHIFSSGKRKGQCCPKNANRYKNGDFCTFHVKQKKYHDNDNMCSCVKILKNGKSCKNKMYDASSQLCKLHHKMELKTKDKNIT